MTTESKEPRPPRAEPEIIPPDRSRARSPSRTSEFNGIGGTHRIYVARLGPVGSGLLMLAVVILALVLLVVLLGTLLIWIPLVALIAVIAALTGFLRWRGV